MFYCAARRSLWSRWAQDFGALQIHPRLKLGLEAVQHVRPTFCQAEAFKPISKGQDCVIYAETGSGKTLAYLLPTLNRLYHLHDVAKQNTSDTNPLAYERPVIVLCPTVDLCAQVAAFIRNIDADNLLSIQGLGKAWGTWPTKNDELPPHIVHPSIKWGSVDCVVSTPVKFVEDMARFAPDGFLPSTIILDEVDLLLHGATRTYIFDVIQKFRPRLRIKQPGEVRQRLPNLLPIQFIFSAATMVNIGPFSAGSMIIERFGSAATVTSPHFHSIPETISHQWMEASDDWDERVYELVKVLNARPGRTLVFVNSSHNCRILTDFLKEKNWPVVSYSKGPSGRMGPRMGDVAKFIDGRAMVNVLTDYGGRGIDWPDVEHVINFQMPRDAMCWVHRVGRTGRVGKRGFVTNMVAERDEKLAAILRDGDSIEAAFSRRRSQRKRRKDQSEAEGVEEKPDPYANAGKLRVRWVPANASSSTKNSSTTNTTNDGGDDDESDSDDEHAAANRSPRVGQTSEKMTRVNAVDRATGFDLMRQRIIENDDDEEFDWGSLGMQGQKTADAPGRPILDYRRTKKSVSAESKTRAHRNYADMDDDVRL